MRIDILEDYESLSLRAAETIRRIVREEETPLLCLAAGDTPLGAYRRIVELQEKDPVDFGRCLILGLDEWRGLTGADPGSCRRYLDEALLGPLRIPEERILFFDACAPDPEAECRRMDALVASHGRISLSLLGVGMNGHLGMNEPGSREDAGTQFLKLDPLTVKVGKKYFGDAQVPVEGYTLGLGQLMASRSVLLLAAGPAKAEIARTIVTGTITPQVPASLLRRHPDAAFLLDREAARLLR
jgi:glucosamine-6-phosphate deaminase